MILLDTTSLKQADQFDLWNEITRHVYRLHNPNPGHYGISILAKAWYNNDWYISDVRASTNFKWRDASHIRKASRKYVKLRRYLSGAAFHESGGTKTLMTPGATYLLDQSTASAEVSADNRQFNVFIPLDTLPAEQGDIPKFMEWKDDTLAGGLLLSAFSSLFDFLHETPGRAVDRHLEMFQNVLLDVLSGGIDTFENNDTINARRARIEAEIDRSLLDPDLSVASLLKNVPMSRASLYRHFDGREGVMAYIRRRRLLYAYTLLRNSKGERGAVSSVAHIVGYGSVHSFHKSFKREFGFKAGDIVGLGEGEDALRSEGGSALFSASGSAVEFRTAFDKLRKG